MFGSFCWSGSRVLIFSNPAKTFITSPLNCTYYLFGHFNILLSVTVLKHKSKIIYHIKSYQKQCHQHKHFCKISWYFWIACACLIETVSHLTLVILLPSSVRVFCLNLTIDRIVQDIYESPEKYSKILQNHLTYLFEDVFCSITVVTLVAVSHYLIISSK